MAWHPIHQVLLHTPISLLRERGTSNNNNNNVYLACESFRPKKTAFDVKFLFFEYFSHLSMRLRQNINQIENTAHQINKSNERKIHNALILTQSYKL